MGCEEIAGTFPVKLSKQILVPNHFSPDQVNVLFYPNIVFAMNSQFPKKLNRAKDITG
jgi:hypothetical protein